MTPKYKYNRERPIMQVVLSLYLASLIKVPFKRQENDFSGTFNTKVVIFRSDSKEKC
jgi:hypothetical protein